MMKGLLLQKKAGALLILASSSSLGMMIETECEFYSEFI